MRLRHIDIARGIGILFVIFGHNWIVLHAFGGKLFQIIFSFHVPLFFFLSGIFSKKESGFRTIVAGKTDSLLKPYFVAVLFGAVPSLALKNSLPVRYFLGALYGNGTTLPLTLVPLWFLPHLWLVIIFSHFLMSGFEVYRASFNKKLVICSSLLIMGYFTIGLFWNRPVVVNGQSMKLPGLPFSADILFISSFFYLLGSLCKGAVAFFKVNTVGMIACLLSFVCLHSAFSYTIDLNIRRFDSLIICTVEALCGIYLVISVSSLIEKSSLGTALAYIGSGSLFILLFHCFIQYKLFTLLCGLTGSTCDSTCGSTCGSTYGIGLIAFAGGTIFPLLIFEAIRRYRYLAALWMPIKSLKE